MAALTAKPLLVLTGPTACGKTRKAVALAHALDAEIISADSRQVYKGMDLGTGKDLEEYGYVKYHLIDICEAGYKYNLYEYLRDFSKALDSTRSRDKVPLMCGGTGLYIESVLSGRILPQVPENRALRDSLKGKSLDELTEMLASMKALHNITDVDSCQRAIRAIEIQTYYQSHPEEARKANNPEPLSSYLLLGLEIPREERRHRIRSRLLQRLDKGMIEEVETLLRQGINPQDLIYYGLEYKFLTLYLTGALSREEMVEHLYIAICQFAKRQMTWFRGMEKRGFPIRWFPYDMDDEDFSQQVTTLYRSLP